MERADVPPTLHEAPAPDHPQGSKISNPHRVRRFPLFWRANQSSSIGRHRIEAIDGKQGVECESDGRWTAVFNGAGA